MKRIALAALLAWIALCTPVLAQSGALQVFPQVVEMSFPDGYAVYTDRGKLVKNVPGPASATIKAKAFGKSFAGGVVYLSDWSFERMQKGEKPNWIVPNAASVAPTRSEALSPSAPDGLVVYPSPREVKFPDGYSVFTDNGQLIKTVPGPTSIALMGESGGKSFANGTAYLSDWSYGQLQLGKSPNWVVRVAAHLVTPAQNDIRRSASDIVVYPSPQKKEFPFGYTSYEGNTITPVERPAALTLLGESKQAQRGSSPAYFSEWSQNSQSGAREPKAWVVPRKPEVEAFEGIMQFPSGYTVFNSSGELVGKAKGPVSVVVAAKSDRFARGVAYLKPGDYAALQQGGAPHWIKAAKSYTTATKAVSAAEENAIRTITQEYPTKADSVTISKDRKWLAALMSGLIYLYEVKTGLLVLKTSSGIPNAERIFFADNKDQLHVVAGQENVVPQAQRQQLYTLNLVSRIVTPEGNISNEEVETLSCVDREQSLSVVSAVGGIDEGLRIVDLGESKYAAFAYSMGSGVGATLVRIQQPYLLPATNSIPDIRAYLKALAIPEDLMESFFAKDRELSKRISKHAQNSDVLDWIQNLDRSMEIVADSVMLCPYQGCFVDRQLRGFVVADGTTYRFNRPSSVKQVDAIAINSDASKLLAWGIGFQGLDCKGWYDFYASKTNNAHISRPTIVSLSDLRTTELPTGENIVWNGSLSPEGDTAALVFSAFESEFLHWDEIQDEALQSRLASQNPVVQIWRADTKSPVVRSELRGQANGTRHRYTFENHTIDAINALRSTRVGFDEGKSTDDGFMYHYHESNNVVSMLGTNSFNAAEWDTYHYNYRYASENTNQATRCEWEIFGDRGDQQTTVKVINEASGVVRHLTMGELCFFVFPLSKDVILIADAAGMRTFGLDKNQLIASWRNPATGLDSQSPRPAQSVAVSVDAKRIFYLSDDSSIHIVDYDDGHQLNYVCRFYMMGNRMPLFMLPDNNYATARPEASGIHFTDSESLFPLEQFDLRLNRPDLVLERLGAPAEAVSIAKQLREKRLKRMGVTEEMLKPDFHVPELEIVGDVPAKTVADEINVAIKASDNKYPLERLKVYVNNVPVNGRDGELLREEAESDQGLLGRITGAFAVVPTGPQTLERTIPIKLAAGRNKIQVSVLNNAGAESLYANAEVNCTAKRPTPTLYAVALGVSDYANPDWNLKYAAKDAKDVLERLKTSSGGSYGEVRELLLTDKQVIKESLGQIRDFLKDATIDDTVLMFVAGHGLLDSKYDYYFGTTDIDFNNPAEKGIAFEEFDDLLASLPCLKKSLLIDTCHAGELDEEEKTLLASAGGTAAPLPTGNGIAMRSIGTRGMNVKAIEGARGASEWYDRLQGLFVDLRRGSGSTILSSSAGAEYALESSEQQNGLFTYAVLEALDGKKEADTNKDGSVQMSELGEYVKKRVSELTNNKQTPNTRRVNLEGDFTLAKTE